MDGDSSDDDYANCLISTDLYLAYLRQRRRYAFLRLHRVLS